MHDVSKGFVEYPPTELVRSQAISGALKALIALVLFVVEEKR